jgi:hypothetical protein
MVSWPAPVPKHGLTGPVRQTYLTTSDRWRQPELTEVLYSK